MSGNDYGYPDGRAFADSLPVGVHAGLFARNAREFVNRAGEAERIKRNARDKASGLHIRQCNCCGNGFNGGMLMPPSAH